ncbi:MAG: hypothetical protein ACK6AD_09790 [Cyanobacteriota bacterium]|jgi:hypothetical protein
MAEPHTAAKFSPHGPNHWDSVTGLGIPDDCHPLDSGARFLTIAAKPVNFLTQLARALVISSGERDRQSEFQLFQLVISLRREGMAAGRAGKAVGHLP